MKSYGRIVSRKIFQRARGDEYSPIGSWDGVQLILGFRMEPWPVWDESTCIVLFDADEIYNYDIFIQSSTQSLYSNYVEGNLAELQMAYTSDRPRIVQVNRIITLEMEQAYEQIIIDREERRKVRLSTIWDSL